jgi:L-ascorbate metabolism protein UlaG (beta-lactamase superfamily)
LSLTYLGHSAFKYDVGGLRIYVDPYFQEPVDARKLEKGDVVLLTHGHFDHGVLASARLWETWQCKFVAPQALIDWMQRKYRRVIPPEVLIPLGHGQTLTVGDVTIRAVPALHPVTRLGKTIHAIFARSSAPGNPVNGYYFEGYYQSGDTIYTPDIAKSLKGLPINTACLPVGGKYKTATPHEALRIAEEIGAKRIVPCHWQPLVEQVPFRYRPSHLVKLAKDNGSNIQVCPLAIGEVLEDSSIQSKVT